MRIYFVNRSTVVTNAQLLAQMPAYQHFARLVSAGWNLGAVSLSTEPAPKDSWQIVLLDDSDQAGALGYHDFTPGGRPIAKIFAKTDRAAGASLSVTISHELGEMMVDPWITDAAQASNSRFYAKEIGDPCEADELGFEYSVITSGGHSPVLLSDFVLPPWFIPGAAGPYDHCKHLTAPLQVSDGGYAQYHDGSGWHQVGPHGRMQMDPTDLRMRTRWSR